MVTWHKVKNGEIHEHNVAINGYQVVVYTDCHGEHWWMVVDGNLPILLEAYDLLSALKEAAWEVSSWRR
jgi:hypothetical protein